MKNSIKILLLENSNVQAKTILQLLRNGENNISVLIAENRKSYIELLNDNAIDIIICNHVLPEGFNSLEAMRIAKNIYPNIPCILLSGSINDDFAIELLKEGFDDYVSNDHLFFLPFSIENVFLKYSYKSEITKLESEIKILQESYNIIDDEKKIIYPLIAVSKDDCAKLITGQAQRCASKFPVTHMGGKHYYALAGRKRFIYIA